MRKSLILAAGAMATPAAAGTITVTIPRVNVAEYHKPYVAVWVEPAGGGAARTLAVWYDIKKGGAEPGPVACRLADLVAQRRALKMPADGVSGITRAPVRTGSRSPPTCPRDPIRSMSKLRARKAAARSFPCR